MWSDMLKLKLHCLSRTYNLMKFETDEYRDTRYWLELYVSLDLEVYILYIFNETFWFWKKKQESLFLGVELINFMNFLIVAEQQSYR